MSAENSEIDIAYVSSIEQSPKCRLSIQANTRHWRNPSALRLHTVKYSQGLTYPLFREENAPASVFLGDNGGLACGRDILFDVFWLLTGQEEKHWPKDKHGFFILNDWPFFQHQVFRLALASQIGLELESRLRKLGFCEPVPRWPQQKKAAVCFTHDVDYPEIIRWLEPIRILRREGPRGLPKACTTLNSATTNWHFNNWIRMEKGLGVKPAFYFCARHGSLLEYALGVPDPFYDVRSPRFGGLFRDLTEEGIEIGLHSSYFAFRSKAVFSAERKLLQKCTGQEISGNRHHFWHLNPGDVESTLLLHEKAGFTYDMSLGHDRYIGWRRASSWPFFPFHQAEKRELKTLQISTNWMDDQLFKHLRHNPGDRLATLQTFIDRTAEQGGCFVADIHDYVFDDNLHPGWSKAYFWLMKQIAAGSDFWIAQPSEVADHWINRYATILNASHGLTAGLGGVS